jgi:hypothetical protein
MRRATAWGVVVGVLAVLAATPSMARADGFWTTIAAGMAGVNAPSDYTEFWFDSPHGPPLAVTQLSGGTAQAITGGGSTFFSPLGTPVLLPTSDGYATLTNLDVANGSGGLPRFAGGTQASGAPQVGQPVPTDSNRASVGLGQTAGDGSRVLSVGITDPNGNPLGNGQVTVPDGGWWVIGLGPGQQDGGTTPPPDPGPVGGGGDPGSGDPPPSPPPVDNPPPPPLGNDGSVATPEPATAVLLGLGGVTVGLWRRMKR